MSNRWTTDERPAGFEESSLKRDFITADQSPTNTEGWEPWLRKQITAHPKIALGAGLFTGLLAGWWVKR